MIQSSVSRPHFDQIGAVQRRAGADQRLAAGGHCHRRGRSRTIPIPAAAPLRAGPAVRPRTGSGWSAPGCGPDRRRGSPPRPAWRRRASARRRAPARREPVKSNIATAQSRCLRRVASRAVTPSAQSARPFEILGTGVFAPGAVEIHEIAETPRLGIPGILDEGRIDRHPLVARLFGQIGHAADEHQRPGIVVDAIAMAAIGHRIDRMLEHAGRIAHPLDRREIGDQWLEGSCPCRRAGAAWWRPSRRFRPSRPRRGAARSSCGRVHRRARTAGCDCGRCRAGWRSRARRRRCRRNRTSTP